MGITVGSHKPHGWSGVGTADQDQQIREFARQLHRRGHATVEDPTARPEAHHLIGWPPTSKTAETVARRWWDAGGNDPWRRRALVGL